MGLPTRAIGFMSDILVGTAEGNGGAGAPFTMFNLPCKSQKIKVTSDEFEVGDTLSGAFKRHQPGRYMFQGTFNCFIDTNATTYAYFNTSGLGITIGNVIWLNYYPSGIAPIAANPRKPFSPSTIGAVVNLPGGGGNDPFICPNFVVFNANVDGDVGSPVTLEFDGKCDNAFAQPVSTG